MKNPKQALSEFNQERLANKAIAAKMNPENLKYDQAFLSGLMEAQKVGKDDSDWEELLDNFRSDLLTAQENGVSAHDYFGMSAAELARQTVEQMPERQQSGFQKWRRYMFYPVFLLLAFLLINLSPWFGGGFSKRNLGVALVLVLMNVIVWLEGLIFPRWDLKIWPEKTAKTRNNYTQALTTGTTVVILLLALVFHFLF